MFEIGRVAVKIAGRDAGLQCVVVDILDDNFVLVDGQTRRRKCNIKHLEPLSQVIELKNNASHDEVKQAFEKLGVSLSDRKPRQAKEKPKKARKEKPAAEQPIEKKKGAAKEKKPAKKQPKKEAKAA